MKKTKKAPESALEKLKVATADAKSFQKGLNKQWAKLSALRRRLSALQTLVDEADKECDLQLTKLHDVEVEVAYWKGAAEATK